MSNIIQHEQDDDLAEVLEVLSQGEPEPYVPIPHLKDQSILWRILFWICK